jgi:hypothetical protein
MVGLQEGKDWLVIFASACYSGSSGQSAVLWRQGAKGEKLVDLAIARNALFWCTLINFGMRSMWALLMLAPRDWMYRLLSRSYRTSAE